jgi:hypothetical protein
MINHPARLIMVQAFLLRSQTIHPDIHRDLVAAYSVRSDLTGFAIAAFIA